MSPTAIQRRYVTQAEAADYLSCTERTIRNYIARGDLTGYRLGTRAIRLDLTEIQALLTPIPAAGSIAKAGDAQ